MNKKEDTKSLKPDSVDIQGFIVDKITYFREIIHHTIWSVQHYKKYDLFSHSDVNACIQALHDLYKKTVDILNVLPPPGSQLLPVDSEKLIEMLQLIIDKLSVIMSSFGTRNFDDLLFVCMGSQLISRNYNNPHLQNKVELIRKYVHPISYKSISWKNSGNASYEEFVGGILCSNKLTEDIIVIEKSNHYECFDVDSVGQTNFHNRIYGIRVVLQNVKTQKTIVVTGIIDDVLVDCLQSKYIEKRKRDILDSIPENMDENIVQRILTAFTLKDYLICGNTDLHKKYMTMLSDVAFVKNTKLDAVIKKFVGLDAYSQRAMMINLLMYNKDDDIQYITYMLYDLITVNASGGDSSEQVVIYDSFPWNVRMYFKDTMKFTIKYTQDMMHKYDINRVSIEQQIYLMKGPEYVKEKAMVKLKEIKGKNDDSGSKAKQYLEGLLKIPFGVVREEPILKDIRNINIDFASVAAKITDLGFSYVPKEKHSNIEIMKYLDNWNRNLSDYINVRMIPLLPSKKTKVLNLVVQYIQNRVKGGHVVFTEVLTTATKQKEGIVSYIRHYLQQHPKEHDAIYDLLNENGAMGKIRGSLHAITDKIKGIENNLQSVNDALDKSIHGHDYAKNQILKIIGQWMNGEQSGYCFGFEGSPGVGKTSVAKKGLAHCLIDADGVSRPFAFIALGGSCNGSTLEGHSYTYVNSIWGRIADILMETKCMNPIIYIDELDKVSKTEQGKEIIGILTHLIDTTQNDCFQDKYFSGINLDLSKALFIFSYNDPENIDRILLDRIHRIRFDNLTLDDKMVIVRDYILPEINRKMGFCDTVVLTDEMIEYIIETFTMEPGVRKLKEILFDLFGEINLELLKCSDISLSIPLLITQEDVENKYLKKYHKIQEQKIHEKPAIGIICGLWANSLGKGGIIPIETMLFPSTAFLELRLTGLQGDVMKESMNVAKSLAWKLTPHERKKELVKIFEETKCQGLHVHCPQGAVSKDGPSAGTAITIAIYSLLNDKAIRNDVAITGEINLQGQVTAIGGLDYKILGGIRGGVKTFLFPKANHRDYVDFMEKYEEKEFLEGIQFIEVDAIEKVFEYVFE
jgi:Lon protease (S16) C-terminal proteolytic domain/ATPase family associated with various cellular activities (AAA)